MMIASVRSSGPRHAPPHVREAANSTRADAATGTARDASTSKRGPKTGWRTRWRARVSGVDECEVQAAISFAKGLDEGDAASLVVVRRALASLTLVVDAIEARLALAEGRSVNARGLAALTGLTPTRVRQFDLARSADGEIDPEAAEFFLRSRRVEGFSARTLDVTPRGWRMGGATAAACAAARARLEELVGDHKPAIAIVVGQRVSGVCLVLAAHDPMSAADAARLRAQARQALAELSL
jgi:hypothetical protein